MALTRIQREPYNKLICIALLAVAQYAAGAQAGAADNDNPGADTPKILFSGYGTLGVVHSSEDEADFTSSVYKPNGAGHSRNWSADVDSRLGLQMLVNFTPKLSAVLQVISEQNYDNSYRPQVEWANVKYQFTPDFSLSAGRVVMPNFLVSDYRKVGYAYPWVRPPLEVYRLLPVTKNDGVAANYRMHFGEVRNTLQAIYGGLKVKDTSGAEDKASKQWGIFNTIEYDAWTFRIAYLQADLDIGGTGPFFDAFRLFGAEGAAIADKYECNGKTDRVSNVGASYDPGQWFLMGEFARINSHCFIGAQSGWYISSGYRFGKFTPFVTYAESKADSNTTDPGLTLSALPPFLVGPATGLNAGLNGILGSIPVQKTISIGGRWDFMKNTALKLQFDHTNIGNGSAGGLINLQPGFQQGGELNVFSATIDFVF